MKLKKSVALVTGASSGIGKAIAERLVTAGYKVYGTSRRGAAPGHARSRCSPSTRPAMHRSKRP